MTLAFLFVECMIKDQTENIQQLVNQVHGVLETHPTSEGSWYDMVVKLQAEDQHKLNKAVHAIKGIAGITAVVTNIAYANARR